MTIERATPTEAKHPTGRSGIRGVTWNSAKNKWQVYIIFRGKCYSLGYFGQKEDAVKMRKRAEEMASDDFVTWYKNDYKTYKKSLTQDAPKNKIIRNRSRKINSEYYKKLIFDMYTQGISQSKIAHRLNISQTMVSMILLNAKKEWASAQINMHLIKDRDILDRINQIDDMQAYIKDLIRQDISKNKGD